MSAWIWVLIPLVAIIGGYIIDYQKNKLKWQNQTNSNEAELEDLKELTSQLKSRIENLEAIAAEEPDEFASDGNNSYSTIEVDDRETQREKNRSKIENIAKRKSKT
jgi:flagellar basal body rod protein FlgG